MRRFSRLIFLLSLFWLSLLVYAVFSYSLTTPNLILTSWSPYWRFQWWMWNTFFNHRELLTKIYVLLVVLLFVNYGLIINWLKDWPHKINLKKHQVIWAFLLLVLPLLLSYNSLSQDVFNYLFNAKMVLLYHANPHVNVALDFARDDWVRFMHNVHTPAPYGYGWTVLSLLPYSVGGHKLLLSWLIFRLFSLLSVVLLYFTVKYLHQQLYQQPTKVLDLALVFLNPLFLIEIISNSHNDLWMIVPAMLSLGLIINSNKNNQVWRKAFKLILSTLLLSFSISTKTATLALIPVWLWLVLKQLPIIKKLIKKLTLINQIKISWPLVASILMFLPLFTDRSKQFLPWYLTWSLVWLPLIKNQRWWKQLLLIFSVTALFRYVPWLLENGYNDTIISQQKMITWSALPLAAIWWVVQKNSAKITINSETKT